MKIYEEEIGNILETEIRENRISGAQAACFLNGEKVVHKCAGYSCLETKRRTETDTIYRIYTELYVAFYDKTCNCSCSNDS